ncbi:tyrosine-type recombinase/integrase [Streptomyces zagrosensis]|uniref:Integrase n=1 Tax=Streptomyces zagrosensis TaxID=1042984 RepID=A0A7W9V2Q3_9ACTN|nr:tyrosine-type recombinase/integrase [Streptomyces zagrosensis]MBB5939511.1 integrase [Streptomyces zagrosensis]
MGSVVPLRRRSAGDERSAGWAPLEAERWSAWLREQVTGGWREGEWDAQTLMFTGDVGHPRTVVYRCGTAACEALARAKSLCTSCAKAQRVSGLSMKEFKAVFVPVRDRTMTGVHDRCRVGGCPREKSLWGLCSSHASLRQKHLERDPHSALEVWVTGQKPYRPVAGCRVRGCRFDGRGPHALCSQHIRHFKRHPASRVAGATVTADWLDRQAPYLSVHQFSLAPLHPLARLEVLYALQQRDARGQKIDPHATRQMIAHLADAADSVATMHADDLPGRSASNIDALLRETHRVVAAALARFRGANPAEQPTLDLTELGVRGKRGGRTSRPGDLDLTELAQPWLRRVLIVWIDETKPTTGEVRRAHRACVTAARALALRPQGGTDEAVLAFADMNAVVDAFRHLPKLDGGPMKSKARNGLMGFFFKVLDYGRAAGHLGGMSAYFARHPSHAIAPEEVSEEDEAGRALPEDVIYQLDDQIQLIGRGVTHGRMTPEEVHEMCRAVYELLRDTGRRPYEIAELRVGCLKKEGKEQILIWDNRKARRNRRHLPVTSETVETIERWLTVRAKLDLPTGSEGYLFPPAGENGQLRHLLPEQVAGIIRAWADLEDVVLLDEEFGPDGTRVPFDAARIFPYAFRHSFCQRHADAGIDPDVLRELMDHRSEATTACYYKITAKRKREAVNVMRLHTTDRKGRLTPLSQTAYFRGSVQVPFGNCTEPSNVKAGGHACPIRFQCVGCPSYHPDPSYLPAMEDHIRQLRAQREKAFMMDVDEFVVRNMDDEVAAYKKRVDQMREQVEAMDPQERERVQEASAVLRKVRAAQAGRGAVALPMPVFRRAPRDEAGA